MPWLLFIVGIVVLACLRQIYVSRLGVPMIVNGMRRLVIYGIFLLAAIAVAVVVLSALGARGA